MKHILYTEDVDQPARMNANGEWAASKVPPPGEYYLMWLKIKAKMDYCRY